MMDKVQKPNNHKCKVKGYFTILYSKLILFCYRFWYVSLVACYRDLTTCKWHHIDQDLELEYDIWLVNGNPNVSSFNPLVYQFSFDRQVQELWLVTVPLMQCLYSPHIYSVPERHICILSE